jgi:hypothetical protein
VYSLNIYLIMIWQVSVGSLCNVIDDFGFGLVWFAFQEEQSASTARKTGELEERAATLREEMKQPMMDKLSSEVLCTAHSTFHALFFASRMFFWLARHLFRVVLCYSCQEQSELVSLNEQVSDLQNRLATVSKARAAVCSLSALHILLLAHNCFSCIKTL